MVLCTRSKDVNWDRIVDIYVDDDHDLSLHINDENNFKLLVIQSGVLHLMEQGKVRYVLAPAVVLLSNREHLEVVHKDRLQSTTVYFKPSIIHDDFTYERLFSGEFEQMLGSTLYQDYTLVEAFLPRETLLSKIYNLSTASFATVQTIVSNMKKELCNQRDGYWPCRSRSYLMELLYFLTYSCIANQKMETEHAFLDPLVGEIIEYLHEHIADEITLTDLTKRFHRNRNQLNGLFSKQTSKTCLAYLQQMRMDLAKIMLAETELPVGEIGARVGFVDTNYFTKVFKKQMSITPSEYRKNYETP